MIGVSSGNAGKFIAAFGSMSISRIVSLMMRSPHDPTIP